MKLDYVSLPETGPRTYRGFDSRQTTHASALRLNTAEAYIFIYTALTGLHPSIKDKEALHTTVSCMLLVSTVRTVRAKPRESQLEVS